MYNFVKLPNELFYGENSLYMMTNDYRTLLVLEYLYSNANKRNVIKFTIENMIVECGYKVDSHKGKSLEKFKLVLNILQDNDIIFCEKNISQFKLKDLIICTLKINLDTKFTILKDSEKDIILNQQIQNIDNRKLLYYYCYLKCRMYKRSKDDGDITIHGGKAETCFPSFKKINEDIGITDDTISKYNNLLVEMDLIRIGNTGHWFYKDEPKNIKEGVNIYTLFEGDEDTAKNNIKETIHWYKGLVINSNKIFTKNKRYKNNDRKINGYIGRIKCLEKLGKATPEQIDKMNRLKESNSDKTQYIYKIKALLESESDLSLSSIYLNLGKEEKSDYYGEIEAELEIFNHDTQEFLVDKEYYNWVISNYCDDYKEFYKNAVKKNKRESENSKYFENKCYELFG